MPRMLTSLQDLRSFAEEFLSLLKKDHEKATVVGLSGDLGSGKTAFAKEVAGILGIQEEVRSPTFVLAKFYQISGSHWEQLIHMDAYRIEDPRELLSLKWDNMLSDPGNLIFVEWPELLKDSFPSTPYHLSFRFVDETTREVR